MKKSLFLGSRAMLVSLGIVAGAAGAQQLKSTEVRGVSLGMSLAQVEAALTISYPNFSHVKQYPAGHKFLPKFYITSKPRGNEPRESFLVEFGQATGRAVSIEREVFSDSPGLAIEPLKAGLEQKYGASIDSEGTWIYGRATDTKGVPDRRCYAKWYGPTATIRPGKPPECGQSLQVRVDGQVADGVYKQYKLVLIDHQAAVQEIRDEQARGDAETRQAAKRAQDAARGVNPQL